MYAIGLTELRNYQLFNISFFSGVSLILGFHNKTIFCIYLFFYLEKTYSDVYV